ncbi:alpha-ketoacid dehydrogenase subunit alpha/beta [Riemerella anatipestifer]|uniref:Thiamine pyrophosphate-dependent enzyme n=2 Tax=Riemerella anatipestifer TaxID=34085 RepID=A0AAP6HF69_RIEAN|nr:alpha-ketoacid dehydrogenase subunit alpha/beta [Riemerella anatipestifer]MCO7354184.1 thiamine pyrophosphate-dependent enzyme [Riemerella anatipestifer]MCU7540142.1 thiamine pyrophosphate-dependent enzyme [Riemerella anatipestifer]MCU7570071.1 thiamine pyrophosphate-dependent enzyme [Riemerella anatipestifer]MCU7597438.1 thiamine pyrophosphate-dependent enzyme [Riemerella anatipestifer]MCW0494357.1 thiamine pyrophosphate-dependent enzyme [Riemerella anatipestifer]
MSTTYIESQKVSFEDFKNSILNDYKLGRISREMSYLGRREVLTGKAKFGIFGDGKELPQLAMARVFRNGDFRSGYYRDQTFALAIQAVSVESFFAQLYADTSVEREPASAGRQMNGHYATRSLNEDGSWKNLTEQKNISSDISPTAGQMPRLLGLAQASKIYKEIQFEGSEKFSRNGNEVAFGTIGDASTAEGHFWETLNAACALQVPMIVSIWDDGYGISVPTHNQRAKADITEMLSGFQRKEGKAEGCEIITVKAWDYPALLDAYARAEDFARNQSIPVVVHVKEVTQPQGHSTSGSHERYKSEERLNWEAEYDGLKQFREWILNYSIEIDGQTEILATAEELDALDKEAKKEVKEGQKRAWEAYQNAIKSVKDKGLSAVEKLKAQNTQVESLLQDFGKIISVGKREVFHLMRKALWLTRGQDSAERKDLEKTYQELLLQEQDHYSSHLYSQSQWKATNVKEVKPIYSDNSEEVDGRVVVRNNFDKIFEKYPQTLVFGEDTGNIGDVNQGLEGMQEKYGATRVADTGIREATILGQGIGMAMRGLRPIAEIQYLDYILYCLQGMSDDLATVQYRTKGGQKAPVIIRTRGHRLEGIWHSGSPMAGILNLSKGILVLVPRNLTKAAGFYNTMLQSDEPAVIVECLNGYRLKEKQPDNLGEFTVPVGKIEVTKEGADVTLVTYGSTWRVVMEAAKELEQLGISAEVIDVQSLIPFDLEHEIAKSLQKTNRLVVIDEDVEGGTSAFILQQILEKQKAFRYLDSDPVTITAKNHRPAYASDGDYFSKPSVDDIVEEVYAVFHETNPSKFPKI